MHTDSQLVNSFSTTNSDLQHVLSSLPHLSLSLSSTVCTTLSIISYMRRPLHCGGNRMLPETSWGKKLFPEANCKDCADICLVDSQENH